MYTWNCEIISDCINEIFVGSSLPLLLVDCFLCCTFILAMIINLLMGADERVARSQQRRDDFVA